MNTRKHTDAHASIPTGAWLALGRGDECSERLREWYKQATRSLAYTGEYAYERTYRTGQAFRGLDHNDRTPQARTYDEWTHEYALNAYRPDTLVYRDGGTREYTLHDRDTYRDTLGRVSTARTTYSRREALAWYAQGGLVLVSTTCRTSPFEIWNAPKWLRRVYAGNGKIKFYHNGRDELK